MSNGLREALARAYPSGEEDLAKNPEAWAFADTLLPMVAAALDAAEARGRAEVSARVQATLNGALMVPQAEIRRALDDA